MRENLGFFIIFLVICFLVNFFFETFAGLFEERLPIFSVLFSLGGQFPDQFYFDQNRPQYMRRVGAQGIGAASISPAPVLKIHSREYPVHPFGGGRFHAADSAGLHMDD
jgi:hypothetical protein